MQRLFVNDCGERFKVPLKTERDGGRTVAWLLWGDHARLMETRGDMARVRARGRQGWLPRSTLGDAGLLELYVIDVGQGDGVLMRTPDDAWHLIDAGVENDAQMTKKGATNFIRWKFIDDLGWPAVRLRNVILSHSDFDHYGGLIDLFSGRVQRPDRTFAVEIDNFYHCGMGRFADAPRLGTATTGTVPEPPFDEYGVDRAGSFITELLAGKSSFKSPKRPFESTFARFASLVATVPRRVQRLGHQSEYLPGYGADDDVVRMRVLGPIVEKVNGKPGLRELGNESVTRNGHSIVLRVDYDKARFLLTGDLNTRSQRLLLSHHELQEFAVDVAKGCHHGSDDVDLRFVRAMKARATVISSGDNEDYAHPRPRVMGASARYGREAKAVSGELLPPLLYSTELARSVRLCYASAVRRRRQPETEFPAAAAEIRPEGSNTRFETLDDLPISTDLVYGLINVRTDGTRIMCAYMKENSSDFDIQAFKAGVEPPL